VDFADFSVSVVISALSYEELIAFDPVDEPVLSINTPGPPARE